MTAPVTDMAELMAVSDPIDPVVFATDLNISTANVTLHLEQRDLPPRDEMLYVAWDSEFFRFASMKCLPADDASTSFPTRVYKLIKVPVLINYRVEYGGWSRAHQNCWLKNQHMPNMDLVTMTLGGYCGDFDHTKFWEGWYIRPCVPKEVKKTGETMKEVIPRMRQWMRNVCGWKLPN